MDYNSLTPSVEIISEHHSLSSEPKDPSHLVSITEANLSMISWHFSSLTRQTRSKLQQSGVSIVDLRIFVSEMIDKKKPMQVLDTISDIDDLFSTLSKYEKIWSYEKHFLLNAIIQEFASEDEELTSGMTNYLNNLAGFYISTALSTYLETRRHSKSGDGQDFALTDEHFCQLRVKIDVNVNEKSLKYVEDLWAYLCKWLALPPYSLLLGEMAKSSLYINFYFPISQRDKITDQVPKSVVFFKEHNIVEVRINDALHYSSEEVLEHAEVSWFVLYCMSTLTSSIFFCYLPIRVRMSNVISKDGGQRSNKRSMKDNKRSIQKENAVSSNGNKESDIHTTLRN